VAREQGLQSVGVELLPIGLKVMEARLAAERVKKTDFKKAVDRIAAGDWQVKPDPDLSLRHLRITEGAFPKSTEDSITRFRTYLRDHVRNASVRKILELACLSVLESISYTRKDGQYLRWDSRAPRRLPGKLFDKGPILEFENALLRRAKEICDDLEDDSLFSGIGSERTGRSPGILP
jgi:site-specific DNA-methyltransferase (cytosine-N4-specific)